MSALFAAGCGSGDSGSTPTFDGDGASSTEPPNETTTSLVRLSSTIPVVGADGDTADVDFMVRRPEHLSGTSMPKPDSCGEWKADYAGINERALILPVDVRVKVTSKLAADVRAARRVPLQ